MFKFEGNQIVWIADNGHKVTIIARTEFFTGKQPRYCVQSETAIPGKNVAEDWINEDKLTVVDPNIIVPAPPAPVSPYSTRGKKSIRRGV